MEKGFLFNSWSYTKKKISVLLIVSLFLTNFSHLNLYAGELSYQYIPEIEVNNENVDDGMFYMPYNSFELNEEDSKNKYLFRVMRKGNVDKVERVKLSMVDITAKYDKDYSIKVIDKLFFNEKVQNKSVSKSIDEYMRDADYEEYNYSDAIVDGSIFSEDIMTEDEKENYEMSDVEKEKVLNDAKNIFDEIGVDADVDKIENTNEEEKEEIDEKDEIDVRQTIEEKNEKEVLDTNDLDDNNSVEQEINEKNTEEQIAEEVSSDEMNNEATINGFTDTETAETIEITDTTEIEQLTKDNNNTPNEELTSTNEEVVDTEKELINNVDSDNNNEKIDDITESTIDEGITVENETEQENNIETTTEQIIENEVVTTIIDETYDEKEKYIASISNVEYSNETVEYNTKIASMSLTEIYEQVTGLKSDKKIIEQDRSINSFMPNINSLNDLAYMQNSIEAVEEELKSAYVILEFKEGQTEKQIELSIKNDNKYRGDKQVSFNLSSVDDSQVAGLFKSLTLIIHDDEEVEPSYINFVKSHYEPSDGFLNVTVERTGDTSSIATCMIDSEDITAVGGRDYSKVHAELVFGFGVSIRKVKIPIVSKYVKNTASFKLKLQLPKGALIGDNSTTICNIDKSDKNFEYAFSNKKTNNNYGSSNNKNGNLFSSSKNNLYGAGSTDYDLDSIILGDPINLEKCLINFQSKKANKNSNHYFINNGEGFHMYLENHSVLGESAYYYFNIDTSNIGYHYDWSGVQFDWSCSKENSDILIKEWMDKDNDWRGFFDKEDTGFDSRTDNFMLENDKMTNLYFRLRREGGCWGKSPTINIEAIRPILKMYKINLLASDVPALINDDGKSTDENKYAKYAIVSIEGDKSDHTAVGWTGKTITVKLDNTINNPFYIKKLWIKNKNSENDMHLVAQNSDSEATTISFKLDSDFALKHKGFIDRIDKPGRDGGYNGEFYLYAELDTKESLIKVVNDNRVDIKIWNSSAEAISDESKDWTYNVGDVLHFTVEVNPEYKEMFDCNGLNVYRMKPYSPEWFTIRKPLTGENYFPLDAEYSEYKVVPVLSQKNNLLIVKVPKNKIEFFDLEYGIFTKPRNEGEDFYEYYIETSSEKIAGNYFDLKARCKDDNNVPVWFENHKNNLRFTQNTFYFLGSTEADDNIVYLTCDQSDDRKYSIAGTAYYEETTIGGKTTDRYWQVAPYIGVLIDDYHFAYANDKGEFETIAGPGKEGFYKKLKIVSNSYDRYINVLLNKRKPKTNTFVIDYEDGEKEITEDIYSVDSGEILISNITKEHPYITGVKSMNIAGSSFAAVYINDSITILEASVSPKRIDETDFTYTYAEEDGTVVKAIENIKRVEFVVVDMKDHSIKKVIEATKSNADKTKWTAYYSFTRGNYSEYMSGDKLYARIVTDRKIGDGKGDDIEGSGERKIIPLFNETTYQAIPTTLPFIEEAEKEPNIVNIGFPDYKDDTLKLPVIGTLESMFDMKGMTFKIKVEGDKVRLYFGKKFSNKKDKYDEDGKSKSDSETSGINLDNFSDGLDDLTKQINESGTKRLGAMTLGISAWSFKPTMGIYFDFMMSYNPSAIITQQYIFTGAAGYFGGILDFKYTFYFLIYGIPFYVGGEINLTLLAEMGIFIDDGVQIPFGDPTPSYFSNLLNNTNFNFLIKAVLKASAYVGVGICGTLGARGGFQLDFNFIWNPTVKLKYPSVRPVGFAITGAIKFWVDAGFLSLDIPVCNWPNFKKLGYFEDLDEINSNKNNNYGNSLYGMNQKSGLGEIKIKPRFKRESIFVANNSDIKENIKNNIFGGTYEQDHTKTLVEDVYDSSEPKLIKYGNKALLVYLDDDPTQGDLDRTTLKYSIYENGDWREPQKVWEGNNTADFSPVLCKTWNRILLAWAKRPDPVDETTPKEDLFKKMEIYTAFFNTNTNRFETPERMTFDDSYDYYPQLAYVYDNYKGTDQIFLYYLKNDKITKIIDSKDVVNNVQPDASGAYLAYMLYDMPNRGEETGRWLKDYYYEDELPDSIKTMEDLREYIDMMKGQRIKDLSIDIGGKTETITDPNISDYVTETVTFIDGTAEEINQLYERFRAATTPQEKAEILDLINSKNKYYNIVAYVVDSDRKVDTKDDTDLFLKICTRNPNNKELSTNTLRITFNNTPDMMPKILKNDDGTYLFWIQNESTIKMLQLDNIIKKAEDEDHKDNQIDIGEVNIMTVDKVILSDKINNFVPFTDSKNNVFIAWQQDSDTSFIKSDDEGIIEFKQDLYVAGLTKYGSGDNEILSWSNPVRFTDNGKVNDLPAVVDFENKLILVNNQYNLSSIVKEEDDLESDEENSYIIENSNLEEIVYSAKSSLYITSVNNTIDTVIDDGSIKYKSIIGLQNTGLFAADGFDYYGQVLYDDTVISNFNGNSNEVVYPGNETRIGGYSYGEEPVLTGNIYFILTKEQQKHLDKVKIKITAIEHDLGDYGVVSTKDAFDVKESFTFSSADGLIDDEYGKLTVEQNGDTFVIKGLLNNTGNTDSNKNEKIYVLDQGDWDTDIASSSYIDLPMGSQMQFEIPIDSKSLANLEKGVKDLVVYVKNDDGVKLSDYEIAILNAKQPFGFEVNGGVDKIEMNEGDIIELTTTYVPNQKYINATIIYSVADGDVAIVNDNKLEAVNGGTTKLTLTTKEFGGSKEIDVEVLKTPEPEPAPEPEPGPDPDPDPDPDPEPGPDPGPGPSPDPGPSPTPTPSPSPSPTSGTSTGGRSSGSDGGGNGGSVDSLIIAPTITEVQISKSSTIIINDNQSKWIFEPVTNIFKLTINTNGQDVYATNTFVAINEVRTKIENGVENKIMTHDTYLFDATGNMITGWVKTIDNKWYFFENEKTINEGKMVVGWKKIQNEWYYFTEDGSMLVSAYTPDGHYVGADGKYIILK